MSNSAQAYTEFVELNLIDSILIKVTENGKTVALSYNIMRSLFTFRLSYNTNPLT